MKFPAAIHRKLGLTMLVPLLLITGASLFLLPRIRIDPNIQEILPEKDSYLRNIRASRRLFPTADFITILIQGDNLFTGPVLSELNEMTEKLSALAQTESVLSVTDLREIATGGGELRQVPLYSPDMQEARLEKLKKALYDTPLFRRFFISPDGKALLLYVFPSAGSSYMKVAAPVERICREAKGFDAVMFGSYPLKYFTDRTIRKELFSLCAIALAVILVIEIIITRSFGMGAVLAFMSALPSVWTLALFPLFGIPFDVYTIIVPILVLTLATSYGIHFFRYLEGEGKGNTMKALEQTAPVILAAGFTTIVAFSSLFLSPVSILRTLGGLILGGISLAVAAVLFFLPPIAKFFRIRPVPEKPLWMDVLIRQRSPRNIVIFALLFIVCTAGALRITTDYRLDSFFRKTSEISKIRENFHRRGVGNESLELIVDSKKEYGFISVENYGQTESLIRKLENLDSVTEVLGFPQIIDWLNGRLSGEKRPLPPDTEESLGETLELASSYGKNFGISSLIDANYSAVRLVIRFDNTGVPAFKASSGFRRLRSRILSTAEALFPGYRIYLTGNPVRMERQISYLIGGQVRSFIFFFIFLFLFLLLIFKSVRMSLLALLPTLSGTLFYFGVMGWFRIPLETVKVFIVAAVMGVSNDDVIYFLLIFRRNMENGSFEEGLEKTFRKTGRGIVHTTLIIAGGLTALLFSEYKPLMQVGIIGALTFIFCTGITTIVIPFFLGYIYKKRKREERRHETDFQ